MKPIDIFVSTKQDFQTLIEDVAKILGLQAQPVEGKPFVKYRFEDSHVYAHIGTHDFFSDEEFPLDQYEYDIFIDIYYVRDPELYKRMKTEVAQKLFEGLKATNQYNLLMVHDLQIKLNEYKVSLS